MKKSKKYLERKSIHQRLMTRAREVDMAHHLQKSKLLKDIRNIEVEYFAPVLAGLVLAILLMSAGISFLGQCFVKDNNTEIVVVDEPEVFYSELGMEAISNTENLQVLPRPQIISNSEVIDFAGELALMPKQEVFHFTPSELPVLQIFNTMEMIAVRARNEEHLLSNALMQIEDLRDLYNIDIRTEILQISENNRAFFLNTHLVEVSRELSSAQGMELALEHVRAELEVEYDFLKSKYEQDLAEYELAFENYNGEVAEEAVANLTQEKAEMESLAEQYDAYGDVLQRLVSYADALEHKRQVIEVNFEALVAGVQVTFDSDIDLGLIQ